MKPQGRILAAGVTGLGADASMMQINRDLGAILILTEFAVLSVIAMILLLAILRGSDATCERAFRLLRWARNQSEPSP